MLVICPQCNVYEPEQQVDAAAGLLTCPHCGKTRPFLCLPLLIIGGASGTGKTTACLRLLGRMRRAVLLDCDLLWRPEFNHPEDNYRDFFDTWLALCREINQSGRPVALFGSGFGVPHNLEVSVHRRYFSTVHYLDLVCSEAVQRARLTARAAPNPLDETFFAAQVDFNRWIKTNAAGVGSPIETLDTTAMSMDAVADGVETWLLEKITDLPD